MQPLNDRDAVMRAIIEGTTDAVFVKDLEGRYLLVNTSCARFIGRPASEILGRVEVGVGPPDDLRGGPPDEARARRVDEQVSPFQVFDEDRVGRALDDGAHHAVAVVERLHGV